MAKKIYNNTELALFLEKNNLKNSTLAKILGVTPASVTFFLDGVLPPEQYLKLKRSSYDSSMLTDNCTIKEKTSIQTNHNSVVMNSQNNGNINYNNYGSQNTSSDLKPVLPTKLYKELNTNVSDYIENNICDMQPNVNQFANFDMFYEVTDDNMAPEFISGDFLALQKALKPYFIFNGDIYCVNSIHGVFLRMLYNNGDKIIMKSCNERFSEIEIDQKDIFNIYRVVGLVRRNI